jgi:hypothetical protein
MQSGAVDWTSHTLDVVLTALKKRFTVAHICAALSGAPEPPKNKVHLKPFLKVMETSLELNAPPEPTGTPFGTLPTPEAQPMEMDSPSEPRGAPLMISANEVVNCNSAVAAADEAAAEALDTEPLDAMPSSPGALKPGRYCQKEQHGGCKMWHNNVMAMVDLPQERVSCGDSFERISCDVSEASVDGGQVRRARRRGGGGGGLSKQVGWGGATQIELENGAHQQQLNTVQGTDACTIQQAIFSQIIKADIARFPSYLLRRADYMVFFCDGAAGRTSASQQHLKPGLPGIKAQALGQVRRH